MTPEMLPPRIAQKVVIDQVTGCWEWTASRNANGYGQVYHAGTMNNAHRVVYQILRGPIASGLHCDHLCRNRGCVNPAHIECVSSGENTRRGQSNARYKDRATCDAGHPYTASSLRINPQGHRVCRICVAANTRAHKRRRRGQ